jgi:hypothetical protein
MRYGGVGFVMRWGNHSSSIEVRKLQGGFPPTANRMFVPTEYEIAFIRDLARRPRAARMCASIKQLNVKRLIDEKYAGIQSASMGTKVLSLTPKGWELVRKVPR